MCLRPIQMPNPAYKRGLKYSSPSILAPCGHCEECRRSYQQSWAVRAIAETMECQRKNGWTVFNTLTYNNRYLPLVRLTNGRTISTWNNTHIKNLLKRIRRTIAKKYFNNKHHMFELKYICFAERGSNDLYEDTYHRVRRGTSRPHYHMIMWIYSRYSNEALPFSKEEFNDIFKKSWGEYDPYTQTSHKYGNVHDELINRDIFTATNYITKYATKDDKKDILETNLDKFELHNQGLVNSKDFLPHSHTSNNVGWTENLVNRLFEPIKKTRLDFLGEFEDYLHQPYDLTNDEFKERLNDGTLIPTKALLDLEVDNPWQKDENDAKMALPRYYVAKVSKNVYISHDKTPHEKVVRAKVENGQYIERHKEVQPTYDRTKSVPTTVGLQIRDHQAKKRIEETRQNLATFVADVIEGKTPYVESTTNREVATSFQTPLDIDRLHQLQQAAAKIDFDAVLATLNSNAANKYVEYALYTYPYVHQRKWYKQRKWDRMVSKVNDLTILIELLKYENAYKNSLVYFNNNVKYKLNIKDAKEANPMLWKAKQEYDDTEITEFEEKDEIILPF